MPRAMQPIKKKRTKHARRTVGSVCYHRRFFRYKVGEGENRTWGGGGATAPPPRLPRAEPTDRPHEIEGCCHGDAARLVCWAVQLGWLYASTPSVCPSSSLVRRTARCPAEPSSRARNETNRPPKRCDSHLSGNVCPARKGPLGGAKLPLGR